MKSKYFVCTRSLIFSPLSDSNYKATVYEVVGCLINIATVDCLETVQKITSRVLQLLQSSIDIQSQLVGSDEKRNHTELQGYYCSVLTCIIRRVKQDITPLSDGIMSLLLSLIKKVQF